MRRFGLLVLLVLGCGGPDLAQMPPPPPLATGPSAALVAATNAEDVPDGPFGPTPLTFADTGCRFVRPPFRKAPEPMPAPRLCERTYTELGTVNGEWNVYDALGRPIARYFSDYNGNGCFRTQIDAKGRLTYSAWSFRGTNREWYRYDDAGVERVAVAASDGDDRIQYALAEIAPDCRSIRWQWWSRDYPSGGTWVEDHLRVEEFDASGVLVAVSGTTDGTAYRTSFTYHPNGVLRREETTSASESRVVEYDTAGRPVWREGRDAAGVLQYRHDYAYDSAGRRVYELDTSRGAETYFYAATYDAAGHLIASDERTPGEPTARKTTEATFDGGGRLVHALELTVNRNGVVTSNDLSQQWSGELLVREDRVSSTGSWLRRSARVHAYDSRGLRGRTDFDENGDGVIDAFTRNRYDRAGHMTMEDHRAPWSSQSYRSTFEYDGAGRQTLMRTVDTVYGMREVRWRWCE